MKYIYHCCTGNYLHNTKRFFEKIEECFLHIKEIIELSSEKLEDCQIHSSYKIIKIDTDILPEYEKIFRIFDGIKEQTIKKKQEEILLSQKLENVKNEFI
jgi:hypothetical protein